MKLLLDMNIPVGWLSVLAAEGYTARHWRELGARNASDVEIMAWARANGFAVFTHDLDYAALLHATAAVAPTVIQLRAQDIRPQAAAAAVLFALRNARDAIAAGALVTIDPRRHRIHFLPLRGKDTP